MIFSQTICIADFIIKLNSDIEISLEEGYIPFLVQENSRKVDISVQCYSGISTNPFAENELAFEAKNDDQRFYSIFKVGKNLGFLIYNQQTKNEIQQVAFLDETFSNWKIYSEMLPDNKINPLDYPMGPILMHYMTLKTDAVMMHASCTFDGSIARLFTGFSGNGKSTISKLWSEAESLIINDDRIIIRKMENDFYVYNTPMYYVDISKKAPLGSIYLISHSPENRINKLSGALAISKVMAFSIQNNFDKSLILSRLKFFSMLCSTIPVYELGFLPNESVVKFILANETI